MSFVALGGRVFLASSEGESHASLPFVHTIKIFQQKLEYFFVLPKGIEPLSSGSKPDILSVELQEQYGCVDWWVARDSNPGPYP